MSVLSAVRCWPHAFLTDMPPPGRRMGIKVVLVSTHQINSSNNHPTDEPRAASLLLRHLRRQLKLLSKNYKYLKQLGNGQNQTQTTTNIIWQKSTSYGFLPHGLFKALAPVRRTPTFYSVWLCRAAGRLPRATPIFLQIFFNNNLGGQPHGPHILCVHTIWLDFVIGRSLV